MSEAQPGATPAPKGPEHYTSGEERYVEFARDFYGIEPTAIQKKLLRAVATHKRVNAVGANGPGKSFIAAVVNGAFLYTNTDSIVMPTSGTYSVLDDTLWKPLKSMTKGAQENYGLPGRCLENPPRIKIDDEWYFKAASPTHPENLEGRHAGTMLITIEEADKPDITREHIDSAESMVTDDSDRMLVISNPPHDESNVVYELMESDDWHTIQFSSFESRNVRIDMGEVDGEKTPGLVDLETVKYDWERWNNEDWPGAERARTAHLERDDLDVRWYRRRAGVMPPDNAAVNRPFYIDDVTQAVDHNTRSAVGGNADGIAADVARKGGDSTVVCELYPGHAEFTEWRKSDHNENEAKIRDILDDYRDKDRPPIAIDAVGEGSGLADRLQQAYTAVSRFKAGKKPEEDDSEYYDMWSEGLAALGKILPHISIDNRDAREQLYVAARVIEEQEKRRRSGDLIKSTPKEKVKERYGSSPDYLDALVMAAWVADGNGTSEEPFMLTQHY